jgi:hypothetical protein
MKYWNIFKTMILLVPFFNIRWICRADFRERRRILFMDRHTGPCISYLKISTIDWKRITHYKYLYHGTKGKRYHYVDTSKYSPTSTGNKDWGNITMTRIT